MDCTKAAELPFFSNNSRSGRTWSMAVFIKMALPPLVSGFLPSAPYKRLHSSQRREKERHRTACARASPSCSSRLYSLINEYCSGVMRSTCVSPRSILSAMRFLIYSVLPYPDLPKTSCSIQVSFYFLKPERSSLSKRVRNCAISSATFAAVPATSFSMFKGKIGSCTDRRSKNQPPGMLIRTPS